MSFHNLTLRCSFMYKPKGLSIRNVTGFPTRIRNRKGPSLESKSQVNNDYLFLLLWHLIEKVTHQKNRFFVLTLTLTFTLSLFLAQQMRQACYWSPQNSCSVIFRFQSQNITSKVCARLNLIGRLILLHERGEKIMEFSERMKFCNFKGTSLIS